MAAAVKAKREKPTLAHDGEIVDARKESRPLSRMAPDMRICDQAELRALPGSIPDRVEVDPAAATINICSRIPLHSGLNVASPGGVGSIPPQLLRAAWRR